MLGWVAVTGSAPFICGTLIQGLLILNVSSYEPERWHGTLFYWFILILCTVACTLCSNVLPLLQKLSMTLHVVLFLALIITMSVVSPAKNTTEFVFTTFYNYSGWSNDGLAWCIGLLSSAYVLIGYDGAMHLSEEMQGAATQVPWAMTGAVLVNGVMGFAFLIALLYCMGDVNSVVNTPTGFPIIQMFLNITGNMAATTVMTASILFMAFLATIGLLTSAGRMVWSFARDKGELEARRKKKDPA